MVRILLFHPKSIINYKRIDKFAPRFAPNSERLYIGDTTENALVKNIEKLQDLGFTIKLHDKIPDVDLYSEKVLEQNM